MLIYYKRTKMLLKRTKKKKKQYILLTLEELCKRFYDPITNKFDKISMLITQESNPNKHPSELEEYETELRFWKKNKRKGKKPKKPEISKPIDKKDFTIFIPDGDLETFNYRTQQEKLYKNWLYMYAKDKSKWKEILNDGGLSKQYFINGKVKFTPNDKFEEGSFSICTSFPGNHGKLIVSNNCNTYDYSYILGEKNYKKQYNKKSKKKKR